MTPQLRRFTNEGRGNQISGQYPWRVGETLKFELEMSDRLDGRPMVEARLNDRWIGWLPFEGEDLIGCFSFIEDLKYGADSVHLRYRHEPTRRFTTHLTVLDSAPRTFFVAIGFSRLVNRVHVPCGYFGIQDGGRVLFSVWDADSTCVVADRPERDEASALLPRAARFRASTLEGPVTLAKFTAPGEGHLVDGPEFELQTGGRYGVAGFTARRVKDIA